MIITTHGQTESRLIPALDSINQVRGAAERDVWLKLGGYTFETV
jgi:hypothetical protein